MMPSILSVALLFGIGSASCSETVDLIERNGFFDRKGKLCFEQVIFWEFTRTSGRTEVRSWRIVCDNDLHNRRPVKSEATGLWVSEWTEQGKRYRIVSRQYRESVSQIDPEVIDRKKLPDELRKGLSSGPVKIIAE